MSQRFILNISFGILFLFFASLGWGSWGLSQEVKQRLVKKILPDPKKKEAILNTFVRIEALSLGKKTHIYFNLETIDRLAQYAESILSKVSLKEGNLVNVSSPEVHRLLCFFVTNYVYAAEAHGVPKEAQVYLVIEDGVTRDPKLELEINNVRNIFERCEKIELKLESTGLVTFNWDDTDYLNSIEMLPKAVAESDVPAVFKDDPLLSKLYHFEAVYRKRLAAKDPFWSQIGDETMNLLMEGVKNAMASGGNVNMKELVSALAKKAQKTIGQKAAKKLWKERRTLIAALTKDDSNLFSVSDDQKNMARALTRLTAVPGDQTISKQSFMSSLKDILGKDAKIKLKVGKDKLLVSYSLKFY